MNIYIAKILKVPLVLQLSWLEHLTVNQRVAGSSPAGGALKKALQKCRAFLFPEKISSEGRPAVSRDRESPKKSLTEM